MTMQFVGTKPQRGYNARNEGFKFDDLTLYEVPPDGDDITLEELEQFSLDRLKVLQILSTIKAKGLRTSDAKKDAVEKYAASSDARKDLISHFALRLAFCQADSKQWFIDQEAELLKTRIDLFEVNESNINQFFERCRFPCKALTRQEYDTYKEKLAKIDSDIYQKVEAKMKTIPNSDHKLLTEKNMFESYYKVPFIHALNYVRNRAAYLVGGFAILHKYRIKQSIKNWYKKHLHHQLNIAANALPAISGGLDGDKIEGLLEELHKKYNTVGTTNDFKFDPNRAAISPENLDMLAGRSYPLCMKLLHKRLRQTHHLKHGGRLQYGLFLKAIGLKLDDAITFWRSELGRIKNFDTNYLYNIKHNYGAAGPRAVSYSPYSCAKIIESNSIGDSHLGCPFKGYSKTQLYDVLRKNEGFAEHEVSEIMDFVNQEAYQVACKKYFDLRHKNSTFDEMAIKHPNIYFDRSTEYYQNESQPAAKATPSTTSTPAKTIILKK